MPDADAQTRPLIVKLTTTHMHVIRHGHPCETSLAAKRRWTDSVRQRRPDASAGGEGQETRQLKKSRKINTVGPSTVPVNLPCLSTSRVCKLAVSVNLPCLSTCRVFILAVSVNLSCLQTCRVCKLAASVNLQCLSTCHV